MLRYLFTAWIYFAFCLLAAKPAFAWNCPIIQASNTTSLPLVIPPQLTIEDPWKVTVSTTYIDSYNNQETRFSGAGSFVKIGDSFFVLSVSHLTNGLDTSIKFHGVDIPIKGKVESVLKDVTLLEVDISRFSPNLIKSIATYDEALKLFLIEHELVEKWNLYNRNNKQHTNEKVKDRLLTVASRHFVHIPDSVPIETLEDYQNFSFIDSNHWPMYVPYNDEIEVSMRLIPGISGSPLIGPEFQKEAKGQFILKGAYTNSSSHLSKSFFANGENFSNYVEAFNIGKRGVLEKNARWSLYNGVLYKTYPDGSQDLNIKSEIEEDQTQGTDNLDTKTEGGDRSTKKDGGDRSTKKDGGDDRGTKKDGGDNRDAFSDLITQGIFQRKIYPGSRDRTGKSTSLYRVTINHTEVILESSPSTLFLNNIRPDIRAERIDSDLPERIDGLADKYSDPFQTMSFRITSDLLESLGIDQNDPDKFEKLKKIIKRSRLVGKKFNGKANFGSTAVRPYFIINKDGSQQFHFSFEEDEIEFILDKYGRLTGSDIYKPVIKVKAKNSGQNYFIDLRNFYYFNPSNLRLTTPVSSLQSIDKRLLAASRKASLFIGREGKQGSVTLEFN